MLRGAAKIHPLLNLGFCPNKQTKQTNKKLTYKKSGVNIRAADNFVKFISCYDSEFIKVNFRRYQE